MKPQINNVGYYQLNMFATNGKIKKELIHRLVALTFIDNPKFPELNETMEIYAQKYGVTKTTIATAWILSHPAQIQVIAGSMTPSRINEITKATDFTLTKVEWYDIYKKAGNLIP